MSFGLVGLYALYFIFVGYNKNASTFFEYVSEDAKGFAPWVVAILILSALRKSDTLKPMVDPFIGLALLTFVLRRYTTVAHQIDEIAGTHLEGKGTAP